MYALREYKIYQLPPLRFFSPLFLIRIKVMSPSHSHEYFLYMYSSAPKFCYTYSTGMPKLAQDALNYFVLFAAVLITAAHACIPINLNTF